MRRSHEDRHRGGGNGFWGRYVEVKRKVKDHDDSSGRERAKSQKSFSQVQSGIAAKYGERKSFDMGHRNRTKKLGKSELKAFVSEKGAGASQKNDQKNRNPEETGNEGRKGRSPNR